MILSLEWLSDYVPLPAADRLVERLLLSGLNHESTATVGADTAIEIEVTSNRPDCLGHIGVAREVAVLFGTPLHVPDPGPAAGPTGTPHRVSVAIESPEICPFYSARIIRDVRIGPSPDWLVRRLATVGVASVNNVVDITNYVMLECGQPLHAFDLNRLVGRRIVVRRARPGEAFTAINHRTYELTTEMGVITDGERPIAVAGVMGGEETEIGTGTTDILLESAQFAPLPVRAAARGLVLMSPSSYRFERGPDPAAVDWAGRRAAALIVELAGGQIEGDVVAAGCLACAPATVRLRDARAAEVLGIDIPVSRQREVLTTLGFIETAREPTVSTWLAPTWRRDAWREIDLVEEIARIEGYDRVPEDVPIPARPVPRTPREILIRRTGEVLVAAGLCEAMTRSVVAESLERWGSPWTEEPPLVCRPALVRGADRLRRTLLPSLLEARSANQAVGVADARLFEIARGYMPPALTEPPGDSPIEEPLLAAAVVAGGFSGGKGLAMAVLGHLGLTERAQPAAASGYRTEPHVSFRPFRHALFTTGRAAEILLVTQERAAVRAGVVGEVDAGVARGLGLDDAVVAFEIRLDLLESFVTRERPLVPPSSFPAMDRDLNLVVEESIPWSSIVAAVEAAVGEPLESVRPGAIWRDPTRLGPGRKSVVVSLRLRSRSGTLSGEEAAGLVRAAVAECGRRCGAVLRSE
jgi:phenylalanyl-tRNA synthetase beta chain